MATSGFDGSIKIDTKINSKGFNNGVRGMGAGLGSLLGVLTKIAALIGLAFGGAQVLQFGKSAVDAASQMSNALVGLQSVLSAQGKSFSEAKGFIDSYIADGLIPATNAIAAYKNLATRGFSTTEIEKLMTVMKDSAAFNRQSAFTMGEAVQKATEGLRNENSLLTDSVGIQKNVAKMWETYAKSIGKATTELTMAEKRQAEINGFIEEGKYFMGDAAKVADTYSGKVAGLSAGFLNFKIALGDALIPAINAVLPYITQLVTWLTGLAQTFGQVTAALFGSAQVATGMSASAEATDTAAAAQENLAEATKEAGKAAKGSLAAFDELNVLQQKQDTPAAEVPAAKTAASEIIPADVIPQGILDQVEAFKQKFLELLEPLREPFERLKEKALELGGTIWDGLVWVWENILAPLGTWLIQEAAPVFLDLFASAMGALNEALIAAKPYLLWLWDNFLKPVAEWTGQAFLDALKWIRTKLDELAAWIRVNPDEFMEVFGDALLGLLGPIGSLISYFDDMQAVALDVWEAIKSAYSAYADWFNEHVTHPLENLFTDAWNNIKASASAGWELIKLVWGGIGDWISAYVTNPVKDAFSSALDWVSDKWAMVFDGIPGFVRSAVNAVIGMINGMINAVADGLNSVIGGMNSLQINIPDWVPGFGGQSWGMNLPYVSAPQIPMLATGAVIPANAPFAAILGDQRSGTNIEAPADLIRQIVREEIGSQEISVNFEGSLGELVRILRPVFERENKRIGSNLIVGGTTA